MKVLVTGVGGQLGHDVMNELASRGYEGIGSDIKETYSGIQDCTAVTTMPYVPMDITDAASVEKVLTCLLYTSPSPRDLSTSRMPSSA